MTEDHVKIRSLNEIKAEHSLEKYYKNSLKKYGIHEIPCVSVKTLLQDKNFFLIGIKVMDKLYFHA